jgi:hypothetical protein
MDVSSGYWLPEEPTRIDTGYQEEEEWGLLSSNKYGRRVFVAQMQQGRQALIMYMR